MDQNQIRMMLASAAEIGAKIALTEAGLCKTEITKAVAYRKYSRRSVDEWIASGKLIPVRRGSKTLLTVVELEILAKTNQLFERHLQEAG